MSTAQHDLDSELFSCAYLGMFADVSRLLSEGADPRAQKSIALRWAATYGQAECVRLLIPVSAPLLELPEILGNVLDAGNAKMLAIMLAHEPRLLESLDVPAALSAATAKGHVEMARVIASAAEKAALAAHVPRSPKNAARVPRL